LLAVAIGSGAVDISPQVPFFCFIVIQPADRDQVQPEVADLG
jgi:hypothetical protein